MLSMALIQAVSLSLPLALPVTDVPQAAIPEDAALNYYQGTWSCKGTAPSADGTSQPEAGQLEVTRERGGLYRYVWASEPSDSNEQGRHLLGVASYDGASRRLHNVVLTSIDAWAVLTADTWQNDSVTWEGFFEKQDAPKVHIRITDTKVDDDTFKTRFEKRNDGEDWEEVGSGTCVRAG